jgi:hypothetical protein
VHSALCGIQEKSYTGLWRFGGIAITILLMVRR